MTSVNLILCISCIITRFYTQIDVGECLGWESLYRHLPHCTTVWSDTGRGSRVHIVVLVQPFFLFVFFLNSFVLSSKVSDTQSSRILPPKKSKHQILLSVCVCGGGGFAGVGSVHTLQNGTNILWRHLFSSCGDEQSVWKSIAA